MEALAIIKLVALVVSHGADAVKKGMEVYDKEVVTVEDVRALAALVKPAKDYFKKDGE